MQYYYMMYFVGFFAALIVNLIFHFKYNTHPLRAGLYTFCFAYGVVGAMIMGKVYTALLKYEGITASSSVSMFGAVIFTPLLIMATAFIEAAVRRKIAKKFPSKKGIHVEYSDAVSRTVDMLTPDIFIVLACMKLGCHFRGCCYGVEMEGGVYSAVAKMNVFPVQILESSTIIVILIICFFLKTAPFYRSGMAYPMTAALYCVSRFLWEFKRYYPDEMRRVVLGMTFWQFCALLVFVASVISVAVLMKTRPASPLPKRRKKRPDNGIQDKEGKING